MPIASSPPAQPVSPCPERAARRDFPDSTTAARASCCWAVGLLLALDLLVVPLRAAEEPTPPDTQRNAPPLTPAEASAASIRTPPGFVVSLFAAEPQVRQPIAMATDPRGRLWVAENYSYAEPPLVLDLKLRDRILILEDADGDGRAEHRTVFWDQAQQLTSVEVGLGGVWAMCPPRLWFLPDRDGDDRPDGPPQVVLDGFDLGPANHHNFANGLRWGPDGWLYGRNGISNVGHVGPPGALPEERVRIEPGLWRYHPTTRVVEMVATGTTNPWGHDWDEHGELFFINTVIGHLWHAVPGAHFERMFGADPNPYCYRLLGQTADHVHWDTREQWHDIRRSVSPTTDQAGGGHAHSGLMIYLGDNWPGEYRGRVFTINLHGRRLNCDVLERHGASFIGHHGQDAFFSSDPWFRGIDLLYGHDGGVYLADWSDVGECHEADGVHRNSGRIFKITYGPPTSNPCEDLTRADVGELVTQQIQGNEWQARQARRVLHARHVAGEDLSVARAALLARFHQSTIVRDSTADIEALRVLWALHVSGGTTEAWLGEQLAHPSEHVRAWVVRLLVEHRPVSTAVANLLIERAHGEPSGLVQLYLASSLARLELADRLRLGRAIAAHAEWAEGAVLPLLLWYGLEPAVARFPGEALALAEVAQIPLVRRFIARRITQQLARPEGGFEPLLTTIAQAKREEVACDLLLGVHDGLRGLRHVPAPRAWEAVAARFRQANAELTRSVHEIAAVFGDGLAFAELEAIVHDTQADLESRRSAIRSLAEGRAPGVAKLLESLLDDYDLSTDAVRGLAAQGMPETTRTVVARFAGLIPPAKDAALAALTTRAESAAELLEGVERGAVPREYVAVFHIRQMQALADAKITERLQQLWPELRPISADKRARIAELRVALSRAVLGEGVRAAGRVLWEKSCANCHTLFGAGGKIGPDLTGSQRSNLDFLLENVIDPSATLVPGFRLTTLALKDGRVVQGVVLSRTETAWEVQTTTEKLFLAADEIETSEATTQSLMPEGLLDVLSAEQIRDLFSYVMSDAQAPQEPASAAGE